MPDAQQNQSVTPALINGIQSSSASAELSSPYQFCTYFDRNYLTRGLALYESLVRHCQTPFVLWVLCFDDETYTRLTALNLPELRLISYQEFETGDDALLAAKSQRSRVEYYWTCTPSLLLYVLRKDPAIQVVTYLDADLYFYGDPQPIFDELGDGSILIIEHRYMQENAYLAATSGIYNVGTMVFRQDEKARGCLDWWRERCLEWCYAYYEDGKFGDQLYLDAWPEQFDGVVVLQHKGAGAAPWNLAQYRLELEKAQVLINQEPLIFFHFHGLHWVHTNVVEPGTYLTITALKYIYFPYAEMLWQIAKRLQLSFVDKGHGLSVKEILNGLLEQRLFLRRPHWIAILLWSIAGGGKNNPARIANGFDAYQQGNLRLMRHYFIQAILHNPMLLMNINIVSLVAKSIVGEKMVAQYHSRRHKK